MFSLQIASVYILYENDIVLPYADNVVLGLIGEHILKHLKGQDLGLPLAYSRSSKIYGLTVIESKLSA